MRILIMLLTLVFSVHLYADFRSVTSKYCDGKQIPVEKDERIFIDLNRSYIGFGFEAEDSCRILDVKSVLIQVQLGQKYLLLPTDSVGRRNSCFTNIETYDGPQFYSATLTNESLTLQGVSMKCESVKYIFQEK